MTAAASAKPARGSDTLAASSAPANAGMALAALINVAAVANLPAFWVAAVAGIIVFASLMGAMFIGQQFLQDVLGYPTVNAGFAIRSGYRIGACSND